MSIFRQVRERVFGWMLSRCVNMRLILRHYNPYTQLHNLERRLDRHTGRLDELAANVNNEVLVRAERAALTVVNERRKKLDEQEARIHEEANTVHEQMVTLTRLSWDLSSQLHQFVKQATDDQAHYNAKDNEWWTDSIFRPIAKSNTQASSPEPGQSNTSPTLYECCEWHGTDKWEGSGCPSWFSIERLCERLYNDLAESE